jgi:hypothetical protein
MIARVLPVLQKPVRLLARSRRFRYATSRARLLPSFLIVGTQHAGTMSLFIALCRHPDVAAPTTAHERIGWSRELHFFDHSFSRGLTWYRSCFPLARRSIGPRRAPDVITGDATSTYLFHPAVPERVAATLPSARLIVLLRDPTERAYAHYESMRRMGMEMLPFEEALAAEDRRAAEEGEQVADVRAGGPGYRQYAYVERGLYADQLERWFAFFPREQFLVLRAEDFAARPAEIYAEVLGFLGLRASRPRDFPAVNWVVSSATIEPALRARLEQRFAEPNARLARLLDREFAWSTAGSTDEIDVAGTLNS